MRFQKHKERWEDCEECELCEQRRKIVLGRGWKLPADICFVGEAPGESEDVLGRPFVGPAGKLLDKIIEKGLDVDWTYAMTNMVACFPRENKKAGNVQPPKESIEACAERLEEFVTAVCKPKVLVMVGDVAQLWLPKVLPKVCRDLKTVGIIHPGAILRMDLSQKNLAKRRCIETLKAL